MRLCARRAVRHLLPAAEDRESLTLAVPALTWMADRMRNKSRPIRCGAADPQMSRITLSGPDLPQLVHAR